LAGTSRGTKVKRRANRKSLPDLSGTDPVIQETPNVDPPAILVPQEVTVQPLSIVPTDHQEAMAQQLSIVPNPPKTDESSPKGTMPTLVPLPESNISPAVVNRCYPEQNNWSPYLTPPKLINASSLGKGYGVTPLDVKLPAAAMLEELLYAEKNISGNDGLHNLGDIDLDSRDGDYLDCGNDDADDDVSQSCATEAGGMKERATAVLFQYSNDNYNHLYDEDIDKDEKRIENSDSNKRVTVRFGRVNLIPGGPSPPNRQDDCCQGG
jgi:hypothetical protein